MNTAEWKSVSHLAKTQWRCTLEKEALQPPQIVVLLGPRVSLACLVSPFVSGLLVQKSGMGPPQSIHARVV